MTKLQRKKSASGDGKDDSIMNKQELKRAEGKGKRVGNLVHSHSERSSENDERIQNGGSKEIPA